MEIIQTRRILIEILIIQKTANDLCNDLCSDTCNYK